MDEDFDTYEQYEPGPYTGDDLDGVDLDTYEDQDCDLDDDLEILDEDPAETAAGFSYDDDYYA